MPDASALVLLGEFGRPHGLRGEVRLNAFTADPLAIASYGELVDGTGRRFWLAAIRPAPGGGPGLLIAQVEGVTKREEAEALNGARLFVPRARIDTPQEEDTYLLADLIGLAVEDRHGERLGIVAGVADYGGGDIIEIRSLQGPTGLLPFTRAFVPKVDVKAGRLVVDPPANLFEEGEPHREMGRGPKNRPSQNPGPKG